MRLGAAFVAMCGCNQVFGLDPTQSIPTNDAPYFDAPADAPFMCPATGGSVLFSRLLHQIPQHCNSYESSEVAGVATAMCQPMLGGLLAVAAGPIEGALTPVAALEQIDSNRFDHPRMTPEGDEVIVRNWDLNTVTATIRVYHRTADTFTYSHDIGGTFDSFVRFGHPSVGPTRRMFVLNPPASDYSEYAVDPAGVMTLIHTYMPQDLGVSYVYSPPSLSPDGLRAVFVGTTASGNDTLFTSRASLDDLFTPPIAIPEIPPNTDPFMTADCGRLYFSAIGYVFWVQRL